MTIRRAVPYEALVSELTDADGRPPCAVPDDCAVCQVAGPIGSEDWPAFLARVRELWDASPQERPAVTPPPRRSLVCAVCGVTFRAVKAIACSKRCRMRRSRARRRAAG